MQLLLLVRCDERQEISLPGSPMETRPPAPVFPCIVLSNRPNSLLDKNASRPWHGEGKAVLYWELTRPEKQGMFAALWDITAVTRLKSVSSVCTML